MLDKLLKLWEKDLIFLFIMELELNWIEMDCLILWDEIRFKLFILVIIFLFLCVVVGVFGNGVVIYVYGFWFFRKYEGCYFIFYLVLVDFFVVVILVEFYIFNNFFFVIFKMEMFCKWNFVCGFFVNVFVLNLLLIIVV